MMAKEDTSTLTVGPLDTLESPSNRLPLIPALTIAWHPDVSRVGQLAPLTALLDRDEAVLQRDEPAFFRPGSTIGSSIESRWMTRGPVLVVAARGKGFELRKGPATAEVDVDGVPFTSTRPLSADDLRRGIVLTVGRRFVFVLHAVRFPVARSPEMGLLGSGDNIEEVRRLILRVAPRNTAVLIRGRSGTGKELVARAIHAQSPRAAGRFVDVNMGTLRPERAAAELFGYEKGAFTGASEAHPGLFRQAHGGTLLLDEVGLTGLEVQQALLRTLQDHRVQSLGSSQPRSVDVRVLAATDANLEQFRDSGRILESFYNRLNTSITISLPLLRARREDVGVLFAHFLKRALRASGDEARLDSDWLKARTVAQIVVAPLEGNVRTLEGLAEHLAVSSHPSPQAAACEYLDRARGTEKAGPGTENLTAPRAFELSQERLVLALEQSGWNQSAAARLLKVSRQALARRLEGEPELRRVIEISLPKLLRDHEACGGDLDALSSRLGLPLSLLRRRLPSRS